LNDHHDDVQLPNVHGSWFSINGNNGHIKPMKKYYVYVIELDPLVADQRKFRDKNPKYIKGNGCVYVGQSAREPNLRFEQHKEGYRSNKYAKRFGLKLRPDLFEKYNPIPTRKDAEEIEQMLGRELRGRGYGVWYN
tara:strand:+ start:105 stop:512 length:408 start_codon:yes stop_codon:yes gene_type:complete